MKRAAIVVRNATIEDAQYMAELWIRSITKLCQSDHHNHKDVIDSWCSGKTPEALANILQDNTLFCVVACNKQDNLQGLGILSNDGIVRAIYVDPQSIRHGVGTIILATLEKEAIRQGHIILRLESTCSGHEFYQKYGFHDAGSLEIRFGSVQAQPMEKLLRGAPRT